MIKDWIKRHNLNKEKKHLEKRLALIREPTDDLELIHKQVELVLEIENIDNKLRMLETSILTRKAIKLGLELPSVEKYQTFTAKEGVSTRTHTFLTKFEQSKLKRQIRIEQRASIEFWFKVLIPVISTLIGLIGMIIALVTVLRKL
ncbi:MAG TPA: hypothetical protein VF556_17620 [Pyrinomonadaceae bacterium]|jgi:hypothetical protein